ncbi:MAG TPA: hypothetical protein VNQ33_10775 [Acidimicrobiales bacterium]|nr:hypothetical protein [Acidimicrobiales bacterium]
MAATPVLAYLDAGTGAALAAVVASGAVGARALFGNAKTKVGRKIGRGGSANAAGSSDEASTDASAPANDAS